ncbi:MAG: tol-pal system YbgF family protein [Sedimentisphaerales bacterium]
MCRKTIVVPLVVALLFLITAGQSLADVAAQFQQAEVHKKRGQYQQAEMIYQQIVTDYPSTDFALLAQKRLTILYIAWNKPPKADSALQQLLANFPRHKGIAKAVHDIAF